MKKWICNIGTLKTIGASFSQESIKEDRLLRGGFGEIANDLDAVLSDYLQRMLGQSQKNAQGKRRKMLREEVGKP